MNHPTEDELISAYYEEAESSTLNHLGSCADCAGEFESLRKILDSAREMEIPDPGADYGATIWRKIEPHLIRSSPSSLPPERPRDRWPARRILGYAALLAVAVGSYWLGRSERPVPISERPMVVALEINPEAVLQVALSGHLERSRRLMQEVSNGEARKAEPAWSTRAERLLAANRTYRLSAESSTDPAITLVLEDLERWFLDVAHLDGQQVSLEGVQSRMRRQGLLLKITILDNNLDWRNYSRQSNLGTEEKSHENTI